MKSILRLIALMLATTVVFNTPAFAKTAAIKTADAKSDIPSRSSKSDDKGITKGLIKTPVEVQKVSKNDLSCRYIYLIMGAMLRQHMMYNTFTPELENRTIDQYIKTIDPLKSYFLASDVEKIKSDMKGMEKWLSKQDCSPLQKVQDLYTQRVSDSNDIAQKYLEKGFKLDPKSTLQMDPQKRDFAKTKDEQKDFEQKYIQFQVASLLIGDMKEKEAEGWVKRRYERNLKKSKEQPEQDTYSMFLNCFAMSLDPHSNYLSADDLEDFNIHMNLTLEGIGATLSSQDGYTVVEQLIPGGSASKSGELESQDKIIAVGQNSKAKMEPVIDMPLKDVVKLIRGKSGTKVTLSILRKTSKGMKSFKVTLSRSKIDLQDEAAQINYINKEVDGKKVKIGILNLPSFYFDSRNPEGRSSYHDVKRLLKEAQKQKIDGLVLDLSQDGGGSLEDAVKLTGLFFKTGNVVQTQGAKSTTVEILSDTDPEVNYAGPLVILTSRLSASASEILAGALQDYKRAIILGSDQTYGKGSVQTVLPLPKNLGAFKVTVGMFFIPGGATTQWRGVPSDITFPSPYALDDIGEKKMDYSLTPKTIPPFLSEDAYVEKGEGAWTKVTPKLIEDLKKKSEARVSKNADFKKIKDELEKTEKKGKVVTLSEIMNDKDKKEEEKEKKAKNTSDPKKKLAEYMKRPDIQESINIMTDYIHAETPESVLAQKKAYSEKKDN